MANFNASVPAVWATIEVGVPVAGERYMGEKISYMWVVLKGNTDSRMANLVSGLPGVFAVESVRVRADATVGHTKKISVGLDVPREHYTDPRVSWVYEIVQAVLVNANEGKFLKEEV